MLSAKATTGWNVNPLSEYITSKTSPVRLILRYWGLPIGITTLAFVLTEPPLYTPTKMALFTPSL